MKLIRENVEEVKYLTETTESGKKNLYIEGVFLVGEQANRNRRMYKIDTLREEVSRYTDEYIKANRALGELGHPDTPSLNLERVCIKIESLKEDDQNRFIGKARVLETPYGNIVKNNIYFTDAPDGNISDQLFEDFDNLPESRATFNGRVFLRKDYTSNQIYDNITEQFTGIGQTYTLTVGGANTVGLGTSGGNGIVIINGIYQTPSTQNNPNNNFRIIENTSVGISSIVFSGITSTNGKVQQKILDLNKLYPIPHY